MVLCILFCIALFAQVDAAPTPILPDLEDLANLFNHPIENVSTLRLVDSAQLVTAVVVFIQAVGTVLCISYPYYTLLSQSF